MIDKMSYSFLGGPPLVKMATGEVISAEDLGGARVHTQVSGGADHFCANQDEAVSRVREILALDAPQKFHSHRYAEKPPASPPETIYDLMPSMVHQGINGRGIITAIADDSHFIEYKKNYAPGRGDNILTGKIRIKGNSRGRRGLQFGGHHLRRSGPQGRRMGGALLPGKDAAPVRSERARLHGGLRIRTPGGIGKYGSDMVSHGGLRPGAPHPTGHRTGQRRGQLRHVRQGVPPPFSLQHHARPHRRHERQKRRRRAAFHRGEKNGNPRAIP